MKNNDQYLQSLSKKRFNRVMSWLCIVIIIALVIATCVSGIMGSKYFMGFLVLMIMVPIIFYIVLWIGRLLFNYGGTEIEFIEQESDEEIPEDVLEALADTDTAEASKEEQK